MGAGHGGREAKARVNWEEGDLGSFRTSLNEGRNSEWGRDFQSTNKKVDAFVTVFLQRHFAVVKIFVLLSGRTASVGISLPIKRCIVFPQSG